MEESEVEDLGPTCQQLFHLLLEQTDVPKFQVFKTTDATFAFADSMMTATSQLVNQLLDEQAKD